MTTVASFIRRNYRHFDATALVNAAEAYRELLAAGSKMLVTLGGASDLCLCAGTVSVREGDAQESSPR